MQPASTHQFIFTDGNWTFILLYSIYCGGQIQIPAFETCFFVFVPFLFSDSKQNLIWVMAKTNHFRKSSVHLVLWKNTNRHLYHFNATNPLTKFDTLIVNEIVVTAQDTSEMKVKYVLQLAVDTLWMYLGIWGWTGEVLPTFSVGHPTSWGAQDEISNRELTWNTPC